MDQPAYLAQLMALLPPGDALMREPGSRLERLLSVPAAELARADSRVEALLRESDPAQTAEMLEDWERALGLPDICYPNFKFSRASSAWYFDAAGVLREAVVDEPRYLLDEAGQLTDAVLVEGAGVNFIRNPWAVGAIAGSPGTLPLHFFRSQSGGLASQVLGVGLEDGMPYLDVRFAFTANGLPIFALVFERADIIAAVNGEVWTGSFFVRLLNVVAGGPTIWQMQWSEANSAGGAVATVNVAIPPATSAPLREQRRFNTRTLAGGPTVAFVRHGLRIACPSSTTDVHDFTLRIGLPQLELGAIATSAMLPAAGTIAQASRAADDLYIATVAERRARVLARLIERFEPTPAAIIGLAARLGDAVTLTEFRPHDCALDCEAPVLDEAWAHAFRIAGASQVVVEFTCIDGCETPLSQWRTGAYECAIRRFAPAQSVPIFSYA